MGEFCSLKCPSCGYSVPLMLGIGYFHPMVLAETQELSRKGKLGATLRRFLAEHPNGMVYPEYVLAQCEKCKEYSSVDLLDMYIPKDEDAAKSNGKEAIVLKKIIGICMLNSKNNTNCLRNFLIVVGSVMEK